MDSKASEYCSGRRASATWISIEIDRAAASISFTSVPLLGFRRLARIDTRRALDVHRRRTSREDEARGPLRRDLGRCDRVGHDLGVHVRLSDAPRDQLGVLRAEVDDEDGVERLGRRHRCG
jgi:hypothetical protein